ncbi:MAG: deoxyguanosinetriphosphate triphosphohydrolase, partial [Cryobacterium sp.]|nr:deoxyguanosinetriphosphate triphosphohydrolase [Cryobacterium sp.]
MAEGQFESSRAKYSNFDRERFAAEAHSSKRSDFSRDRARILHSSALRRLSAKTQVLSPTAGVDNARNRLTHSLEVAQVGRELASSLGLDPDVVDAACLAHDLGHPPFGHNGERALNDWCSDIGGFEGNAQTFRLLTRLESKVFDSNGRSVGLNLTRASLSASCKYPWPASSAIGDPSGRAKFGVYSEDLEIFNWMQSGSSRSSACIEAQVMDLSDDIAYSVHDFEDAIQSGYIDVPALGARVDHQDLVDSMFEWIGGEHSRDELIQAFDRLDSLEYWIDGYDGTRQANSRLKNLTSQLIGRFVGAAIQQTLETNSGSGASIRDSEISV